MSAELVDDDVFFDWVVVLRVLRFQPAGRSLTYAEKAAAAKLLHARGANPSQIATRVQAGPSKVDELIASDQPVRGQDRDTMGWLIDEVRLDGPLCLRAGHAPTRTPGSVAV